MEITVLSPGKTDLLIKLNCINIQIITVLSRLSVIKGINESLMNKIVHAASMSRRQLGCVSMKTRIRLKFPD